MADNKNQTKTVSNFVDIIKENNGVVNINDNNIFSHKTIGYYITKEDNELLGEKVFIKPKDYLINLLNNEILTTKKKWLV